MRDHEDVASVPHTGWLQRRTSTVRRWQWLAL